MVGTPAAVANAAADALGGTARPATRLPLTPGNVRELLRGAPSPQATTVHPGPPPPDPTTLRTPTRGPFATLDSRLRQRPRAEYEAIVEFKRFAFRGESAKARAEIDWAEEGLALLDRLEGEGVPFWGEG